MRGRCAAIFVFAILAAPVPAAAAGFAPVVVQFNPATALTPVSITVSATINPEGLATSYLVNYGTTTAYGQSAPGGTLAAGTTGVPVSVTLTGLTPDTFYYYQVIASNSAGRVAAGPSTFSTPDALRLLGHPTAAGAGVREKVACALPSCAVTITLRSGHVVVGRLAKTVTGRKTLVIALNGTGRSLLTRHHRLPLTIKTAVAGGRTLTELLTLSRR